MTSNAFRIALVALLLAESALGYALHRGLRARPLNPWMERFEPRCGMPQMIHGAGYVPYCGSREL